MFQAGQLAMYTSGPWNINGLNQLGVNYGITAIPAGSAGAFFFIITPSAVLPDSVYFFVHNKIVIPKITYPIYIW